MNNKTVVITAYITAKNDKISEVEKILTDMIIPSRKETGCLKYELYRDIENLNSFTFIEEWENEEAIENHRKTEHYISFRSQIAGFLSEPVKVYRLNQIR